MASDEVDIAVGYSLVYAGTSLGSRQILDVTLPDAITEMIETTHQGTTTAKTFTAADIGDNGTLTLIVHHFQDYDYFADRGFSGPATLTTPSGATLAATMVYERYTPQQHTLNEKMLADVALKISGDVVVTPAS